MNTWADLNRLQTGKYGEYFAKMALILAGFDVFSPDIPTARPSWLRRGIPRGIRRPDHTAGSHASAGDERCLLNQMIPAPLSIQRAHGSPKLAHRDDEGVVEKPITLQIRN